MMSLFNEHPGGSSARSISWEDFDLTSYEISPVESKKENRKFIGIEPQCAQAGGFVPLTAADGGPRSDKGGQARRTKDGERLSFLEQEAYEKGFAQGEKDGFELGGEKAKKAAERIERLLSEMVGLKEQIVRQYEKEILDLAFAIADKIVGCRVRSDEGVVGESIRKVLLLAGQKSKIVIRVNPEDHNYVEKLRPELFSRFKEIKSVIVTSDPSISRGGCFLETDSGDVNGSIEAQMEIVRRSLDALWGGGRQDG